MKGRLVLLAVGLVGAMGVSVTSAAAEWLLPASTLSLPAVDESQNPRVAIGPNGLTTVVWTRDTGTRRVLEAATRKPGNRNFGSPVELTPVAGSNLSDAEIAIGPGGLTTIVYELADLGNTVIGVATRPSGSSTFSDVIAPASAYPDNYSPRVVIGPDGTTTIAWAPYDGAFKIATATRAPGANSYSPIEEISAGPSNYPRIVAAPDGTTTLIYEGTTSAINFVTRPQGAASFSPSSPLSSPNAQSAELAVGAGGTTAAVWTRSIGLFSTVQATVRGPLPAAFSPPVPISIDDNARDPEVAVGPDGTVTVVWVLADGPGGVVQASTKSARSNAFSAPVSLSDGGELIGYPKIAVGPDGKTTVVWNRGAGADSVIQAVTREAGASTFSTPVNLTEPGSSAFAPEIEAPPPEANPCATYDTAVWERAKAVQQVSEPAADCPAVLGKLRLKGPKKASQGRRSTYRVTVRNTGSGQARGLRVRASGKGVRSSRKLGTLSGGKSKTVKLPLKFTKPGKVRLRFTVTSTNAGTKTVKKVVRVG